jgi:phosphoglycerate dehydrogenase-like enzyme
MKAVQMRTIDEVLAASDFVSLHCPGGAENRISWIHGGSE